MKQTIEKHQCKMGLHKWGKIKEEFVDGKVVLARKCELCGKIKAEKEK